MYLMKNSSENIDVLNRAGYYYNMLKNDLDGLKKIFDDLRTSLKYKENFNEFDVDSKLT